MDELTHEEKTAYLRSVGDVFRNYEVGLLDDFNDVWVNAVVDGKTLLDRVGEVVKSMHDMQQQLPAHIRGASVGKVDSLFAAVVKRGGKTAKQLGVDVSAQATANPYGFQSGGYVGKKEYLEAASGKAMTPMNYPKMQGMDDLVKLVKQPGTSGDDVFSRDYINSDNIAYVGAWRDETGRSLVDVALDAGNEDLAVFFVSNCDFKPALRQSEMDELELDRLAADVQKSSERSSSARSRDSEPESKRWRDRARNDDGKGWEKS